MLNSCCDYGTLQPGGVAARRDRWTVGAKDVPSAAHIEAGSLSAGAALPAVRHVEDDGQRRHVLRASRSFHIHFQVLDAFTPIPITYYYYYYYYYYY